MGNCCATTLSYLRNEHGDSGKAQYRPSKRELEFEDLLTSDQKQKKNQKGILTAKEINMLKQGKINELVDQQTVVDAEIDAQLAKEEEKLRLEEQWSAAKRVVAKKAKKHKQQHHKVQVEIESSLTDPATAQVKDTSHLLTTEDKINSTNQTHLADEDDFDQFLEDVKARSLSVQKQAPDKTTGNIEEEEIEEDVDFGYWESAMLEDKPSTSKSLPVTSSTTQDIDLDLL